MQSRRSVNAEASLTAVGDALQSAFGELVARRHFGDLLHVLEFRSQTRDDLYSYVSLGLSRRELEQDASPIRQELLVEVHPRFAHEHLSVIVATIAGSVALGDRALPAFEILELDPALQGPTRMEAVMAFTPLYHPVIRTITTTSPVTVPVWLVAIRRAEAEFGRANGWEPLVACFEERQPDFLDLARKSAV